MPTLAPESFGQLLKSVLNRFGWTNDLLFVDMIAVDPRHRGFICIGLEVDS